MKENTKNNTNVKSRNLKNKLNKIFIGRTVTDGLLYKIVVYTLLISFSYVYLYPILYMITNSFMGVDDLINTGVVWVPTKFTIENYVRAIKVLEIPSAFFTSIIYALISSVLVTASSAIIGYGFAKFNFPGKKILFALMLITFILPQQVTLSASIIVYRKLGLMSSKLAMYIPAMLGQGLNQAIFILIFYQFFNSIPNVLNESAEIDGANQFEIFFKINLPLAIPSIVVVFLFGIVFYWNETLITSLFTGGKTTLPIRLNRFEETYFSLYPPGTPGAEINEAIMLAGSMLVILPLLIIFFIGQKQFVESIDKTGITGE